MRATVIRFAAVLILLAAIASPLVAQIATTKEQAERAIAEFREFAKHRNAHVRKAAVEGLFANNHYLIAETLLEMLDDPDPLVSKSAEIGLETQTSNEAVTRMVKRLWLGSKKPERLAILRSFRKSMPASAYSLVQDLCGNKDWEIRATAAEVIGCFPDGDGKGIGSLLPLFKDPEVLVRLAAIDAAAVLANPRANLPAIERLEDSDWRVQASAIRALALFRQKSAIQPLIDFMKSNSGRLVEDAGKTLVSLTGFDYPAEPKTWQEWWDRVKDTFKVPTIEELEAQKKKQADALKGYAKSKREYPPYHGIETRSRRMIFVVDVSSSMSEKITLDERNPKAIEEYRQRYGDTRVKIDIAREELINMVAGLQLYVRFNIITYNAQVQLWEKGLVAATPENRNRAIKYLARLTPASLVASGGGRVISATPGQTNTYEAINACFSINAEDDTNKSSYKTEADTAFLLSDGNPTIGRIVEPQMLLDYVQAINRKAKLVIHTISFGNGNRALMEPLAKATGGQYVRIGD